MDILSKLTARLSDFDPTQYLDEALGVLVILIMAWVLIILSRRAIRIFAQFVLRNASDPEDTKRVATLSRVFRYLSTVTIVALTIMLVLGQIGISIAPILGAAGVLGIAVGFGAQSIVKDFFTGFTILLENKIRQGDVVRVAGIAGLVEGVTLRTVRLRSAVFYFISCEGQWAAAARPYIVGYQHCQYFDSFLPERECSPRA